MFSKTIASILVALFVICGITITTAQPPTNNTPALTTLTFYTGGGFPEYVCTAYAQQLTTTFSKSSTINPLLTNIVVLTNVGTVTTPSAHGLTIGNQIVVSGATVDTDLNATYRIITTPSTTTFTITTANVANATYTESTLKFTTTAPRNTSGIWNVEWFQYNGSNQVIVDQMAGGKFGYNSICANRTSLYYQ